MTAPVICTTAAAAAPVQLVSACALLLLSLTLSPLLTHPDSPPAHASAASAAAASGVGAKKSLGCLMICRRRISTGACMCEYQFFNRKRSGVGEDGERAMVESGGMPRLPQILAHLQQGPTAAAVNGYRLLNTHMDETEQPTADFGPVAVSGEEQSAGGGIGPTYLTSVWPMLPDLSGGSPQHVYDASARGGGAIRRRRRN